MHKINFILALKQVIQKSGLTFEWTVLLCVFDGAESFPKDLDVLLAPGIQQTRVNFHQSSLGVPIKPQAIQQYDFLSSLSSPFDVLLLLEEFQLTVSQVFYRDFA
jgi:hypothetical protein